MPISRRYIKYLMRGCVAGALVATGAILLTKMMTSKTRVLTLDGAHDFGVVHPGELLKHKFMLSNPTQVPLTIREVKTDCACVGTRLERKMIPPRETAAIEVYFQTKRYPESAKSYTVVSGSAGRDSVQYRMMLSARSEDVISFPNGAGNIVLPDLSTEELPRTMIVDVHRGKYPLDFDSIQCRSLSPQSVQTALRLKDENTWALEITIPKVLSYGNIYAPLEFSLCKGGVPYPLRIRNAVVSNIVGPVTTDPASVLFGTVKEGGKASQVIRVASRTKDDTSRLDIVGVTVSGCSDVVASIESDATTGQEWVAATLLGHGLPGPRSGTITIQIGDEQHSVSVSFLGMIER